MMLPEDIARINYDDNTNAVRCMVCGLPSYEGRKMVRISHHTDLWVHETNECLSVFGRKIEDKAA